MPDGAEAATDLKIRTAQQVDASTILRLLQAMHQEKELEKPFSADKIMGILTRVIAAGQALVLGDGVSNRIVGMICLDLQVDSYTVIPHMIDIWTYVHPKHRSPAAFRMLVRQAEELAAEREVKLRLAIFGTKDLERRETLYLRAGWRRLAILFEKE